MSADEGDAQRRALCWFRRDLRLDENPAWAMACEAAEHVVAVFVLDDRLLNTASPKRRALLFDHLRALDESIKKLGGRLHVAQGEADRAIPALVRKFGIDAVYFNADTTPFATRRDNAVERALDVPAHITWGTLVHPPGSVLTAKGTLSKVFTPFYKRWMATAWDPWMTGNATPSAQITDDPGAGVPDADDAPLRGGEEAAHERLLAFLDRVDDYPDTRDLPGRGGTSGLSSDLRFGTISPRQVATVVGEATDGRRAFTRQLAWRDWYAHLLAEHASMPNRSLRDAYNSIEWLNDAGDFDRWCQGLTGYPIVDAGMRQLTQTGWMHNRVRMIAASFLVKDLLVDWRRGERFFRYHLIDADVAQNAGNWQWVAGTGPDAAPYFRVFNPITQSRRFDDEGTYIRRYVPELAGLRDDDIHAPWEVAPLDLAAAGVTLGAEYPEPIIEHGFARERALAAYKAARASGRPPLDIAGRQNAART